MQLNEKGYYFTILMYGLFSAVSLQKSVRDRLEGIPVTNIYYGLCWVSLLLSVGLLAVGLFNATLAGARRASTAWRSCSRSSVRSPCRRTCATSPHTTPTRRTLGDEADAA